MSDTIFHKIIRHEIPATIVFEDEELIAFRDVTPVAPVHILVVPKETIPSLREATAAHEQLLGRMLLVVTELARKEGIEQSGYRVVINAGPEGGQTVMQLHMHLIGKRPCEWPPG